MNILKKIAAVLALIIGLMTIFAGSRVLLGIDTKDYHILTWLVVYNVIFGLISIFAAFLIWKDTGKNITLFILGMHFIVFLYLQIFSNTVAAESVKAMIFRTTIWLIITVLSILIPTLKNKNNSQNNTP